MVKPPEHLHHSRSQGLWLHVGAGSLRPLLSEQLQPYTVGDTAIYDQGGPGFSPQTLLGP